MSAAAPAPRVESAVRPSLRWSTPAVLLVAEYAVLSVIVDFPTSGPGLRIATAARMLVPVALGALSAGWLISREGMRVALRDMAEDLPRWRPKGPLVAALGAFIGTAWLAHRLLGPGAPEASTAHLLAVAACAAVCIALTLATAAPLGWLARFGYRHLRAPAAAVAAGVLAWRTALLAEGLWGVMGSATLHAVGALLLLVRPDARVLPEQSVIGVDAFEVVIAPICSGVDGFGLVLVFQVLWLSLARARIRFGRALLLLPLGAVAAMGTNIVRIAVLVLLGASGREDLALGAFHSKLGWLLFVAVALASVAAAEHVAWFRRPDAATPAAEEGVPRGAGAYLGPLVAALGASLLTSLWGERSLDPWYGARVAAAGLVLLAVRNQLPRPALTLSCVPVVLSAAVSALWIAWPHAGAAVEAPRAAWVAARLLGSCLVLPIVEELAFRGFLLPWLVSPDFEAVPPRKWTLPAVLLSSLAFGALHERWMLGTFAGLAFAAARLWRGRLGDAILAHALANAGIAAAVLIGGRWDLWS